MKALIRIVDDDEELARSYALLLETAGWECRVWTDGTRFLEEERFERPGCVILDMRMPGMNGLEVQKALAERGSVLPILFLSAHGTISAAVEAVRVGALDFLEKPADPDSLIEKTAAAVERGQALWTAAERRRSIEKRFLSLTPRERDVVEAVLDGASNKEIARRLSLEVSTVKMHRAHAFAKLDVHSPQELTLLAHELDDSHASPHAS